LKNVKWLTILFILLLVVIVFAADSGKMPGFVAGLYDFPNGDKVGHFVLMGLLSLLVNMAVLSGTGRRTLRRAITTSLVVVGVVAVEEFSQRFFPGRNSSWADLASSLAGIIVFGGLAWFLVERKKGFSAVDEINKPEGKNKP
jgi:polysaccharide biosynthesis protein VpsQ